MKPPWETEEAGASDQQEPRFAVGEWVRRRGEEKTGQIRSALFRLGRNYSVTYNDNGTLYTRILSEDSLIPAQQPTRFGGGSGH